MDKNSTGLFSNLKILYKNYGGISEFFTSGYFYTSLFLTVLCWRLTLSCAWSDLAKSVLPTLSGFSIAAYAIFFSVLDEQTRDALKAPAPTLSNRSPLLMCASSISHGVVMQIFGLILAIIFTAKPLPTLPCLLNFSNITNIIYSSIGLFVTIYGILLILASILSIFRILEITSKN